MKFKYQARTQSGEVKKGEIEATSKVSAIEMLHKSGLYPTSVKQEAKNGIFSELKILKRVSTKEVVIFTREVAIMIESNVPPAKTFEALAEQMTNATFKEKVFKIAEDIREGVPLSKALSKHPKIFSTFYVSMVRSGEASGTLPEVFNKIAEHLENEQYIRTKTMGAMVYPVVILIVFTIIFIVIVIFIIPGLTEVLQDAGAELPLVTKIVIGVSDFFIDYWWLALLAVSGLVSFLVYFPKTKEGKEIIDLFVFKVPIFGTFQKNVYMNRFAENLATLLYSGKSITESLEITASLIGNNVYKKIILDTKEGVIKGRKISDGLARQPQYISPLFVQMVAVGESTGRTSDTLLNVVKFYKAEIETFVDSISDLIEPVLILGLAGMVGILVAAVFLPLYQIGDTIQ